MKAVNAETITKRVAIDKAKTQMLIIISIASFISIFCLVASKDLYSQNGYLNKVVSDDKTAKSQLQTNLQSYNQLVKSYEKFNNASTNIIGGPVNGNAINSGSNSKLILDALPPAYDFPGLASTLGKILTSNNYDVTSIGGSDEELTQGALTSSTSPAPVEMPFTLSFNDMSYIQLNSVITLLQTSIRPIEIDGLQVEGDDSSLTVNITAHTYYQPSEKINISTEAVQR
jgi:hypothetical protein